MLGKGRKGRGRPDGARAHAGAGQSDDAGASTNPFSRARLGGAPALAVTALVVGVLAGAALLQTLVLGPANREHARALAEAGALELAGRVEATVARLSTQAAGIARDPRVLAALRAGQVPPGLERELAGAMPEALRVRVLPVGGGEPALAEDPPLTFAGIDLLRRAEFGEAPAPEAFRADGRLYLNAAARVEAPAGPLGTVLVTWDAGVLGAAGAGGRTRATLVQLVGGAETRLLGEPAPEDAERVPLDHPAWRLRYVPATAGAPLVPLWLGMLPFVVVLAVPLLGLRAGFARLAGALRHDLDRLVESAAALTTPERNPVPASDYVLDASRPPAATLEGLVAEVRSRAEAPAPAPAPPKEKPRPVLPPEPDLELDEHAAGDPEDDFLELSDEEADTLEEAPLPESEPEEELDDLFDLGDEEEETPATPTPPPAPAQTAGPPAAEIFRAYDVRGVVDETLTADVARQLGQAIGSEAADHGERTVVVGADGRHSSPLLKASLIAGLTAAGRDVIDVGEVPTPVLYYATHVTGARSGVMVTGSHNAPEYNGFKIVIAGETLADGRIAALRERIAEGRLTRGDGSVEQTDVVREYVDRIAADVALAQPLRVVVDCGNGVAGAVLPRLLEAVGCEVLPLYCDVDGDFPNHHPDPADPANLQDLATVVRAEGADLGIALDGDGDRIGMVTERGDIVWPDRLLMLFARDIVGRNPGADVVFDVKCSRHLHGLVAEYGGRPILWRTGHSHIKAKMKETGALLGGEFSGHLCFRERWYGFDDGLYSAARLLEIVGGEMRPVSEIFAEFPADVSTPEIRVPTTEGEKFSIVERLASSDAFTDGDVTTLDGVRVDYANGWGLVRASNTSPVLTLRFEGEDTATVHAIVDRFRGALRAIDPALDFTIDL
jgi:phosphomannomutase/phosphoglucomutase